ncbi:dolichyl-phosphate-mannose-protein mannosyltransferase [Halanaerobium saccharolyticum]|uniref:Dolichyl-phosphate-mannose-protein mannosyltransferase n=1 Tax=Halanaerobium saccharolyticum TaxID=43595 RepID=A0A4R6LPD4_9FIRM|nr:glycosyltransferase family 39 protein [Halanaerobium saccharolyticum]TDO89259.1 dolichyl-phosphate-mannose-protein mannosyltransferase [Halanaerobium saccharolyticum]
MDCLLKNKFEKIKAWHLIIIFFLINLFFLNNFPFIHSDEAWLSGLSRQIMETGNLASTEAFFDLLPRHPHAVKVFFHLLQIIFIKIFNYRIFTFRLISLLTGSLSLFAFYKISYLITKNKILSLGSLIILAVDIHFIYSSHIARQEIILILFLLNALYYFLKKVDYKNTKRSYLNTKSGNSIKNDIFLGVILGTAIGFHPNAFIIALPLIIIYSWNLIFNKKTTFKNYISFGGTLALIAGLFIYLSFQFDPEFINNYSSYGAGLGVLDSFLIKLENLKNFYLKLFYRISGTYYIPPIKFQLLFFAVVTFASLVKTIFKKDRINLYLLLSLFAINLGYLIIGRYNQTSIIFIFPLAYLLFINLIKDIKLKQGITLLTIIAIILSLNTGITVFNDSHYNYQEYLQQIAEVVPQETRVLANLNTDYYFKNGSLFDYRNLDYLEKNNLSFSQYIVKNEIEYIIYPEEMDFIYNSRPTWNILYGNLYPYYSEMQEFLDQKTELIKTFSSSTYAMRIVRKIGQKNWSVKIYKVNYKADPGAVQKAD